ncbi:MAG: hypothetical protein IKI15_11845 [Lachnospiraceae bacterium]|nr:hypothetical protein [Lachnospiraceae bacterium]
MKKISAWLLMLILLISCVGTAFAADEGDLPFDVKPPQNVSVEWMNENDSPTTMNISFSVDPQISQALIAIAQARDAGILETMLKQYGATDIYVDIQVDWAIDDVNDPVSGWHYNKYWDDLYDMGFGIDEDGRNRCSEWDVVDWGLNNASETVQSYWIMRGVPDGPRWNGNPETGTPGVKDQLRPDQYDYHDDNVYIDFTKHTAYFRVRYAFTAVMETEEELTRLHKFSDWSEIASYGKDAVAYTQVKDGDIAAPEITDLHMTDKEFNGNPVVAYTLTVPDALMKMATEVAAHGGGIRIDTEARVKGDTEWVAMGNSDWEITPGNMECALISLLSDEHPTIDKNTPIELRCRYRCSQAGVDEDVFSEYSKVLTFETTEINNDPEPTPTETPVTPTPEPEKKEEAKKDKCPLCGFCPQPLGLCIFIWLAIIIVIVVVVIIVVKKTGKKEENGKQ